MEKTTNSNYLQLLGVSVAVLLASWGGLPTPPGFFKYAARNIPFFRDVFRLLMYILLVYLATGRQKLTTVALVASIVFLVFELIKYLELMFEVEY